MIDALTLQKFLQKELSDRQKRNPAFSLRSLAKAIEISPSALSQVLSGKRELGKKSQSKVYKFLNYTSSLPSVKKSKKKKIKLEEEVFQVISNWLSFAILSLGETSQNLHNASKIASLLSVPAEKVNKAFTRLRNLGIIEIKNGRYHQVISPFKTSDDIPSNAIKKFHRSVLNLALEKLDLIAPKDREFRSLTLAINSKHFSQAKELTRKYFQDMESLLENGKKDAVYQLNLQMFPLINNEKDFL